MDAAGEALTDPGGGAIGDLSAAFQRLERSWGRDRRALTDGLAAAATLFDALPDPLVTLDRQARLVYANAAARALLAEGRAEDDLQGRDLSAVLRQPLVLEAVGAVLAGATTREVEFTFTDRIDQNFEARVEAIAGGDIGDDDAMALLLLRDVTARQRSEQSRADFVANVSHELRTPLTSLIGFIETLRGPARNDREASARFLALMATQSSRMARLVDDLLSLSRIEMNEHTAPDAAVDLENVIGAVIDLLTPQARERDISIQTRLESLTGPVTGAQDELVQLFQNLIENAIKYARKGSAVHIEADTDTAAGAVTVSVIDQGDGIANEHLARLTERFYRIDTARSRELGGTGLGLAIVKHIVNRHRGDLAISSVEGEGSTFAVTLRLAEPAATAYGEPATVASN
jgi:two-component system phosphate regulon sensor histidine kinase PhoR